MIVLSGDIGGTSTRLQLSEHATDNQGVIIKSLHYSNSDYTNFLDIIDTFFRDSNVDSKVVGSACFGVAGPIINGTVRFTNLLWVISENDIKNHLRLDKVKLINDFSAIGYGIETLQSEDLITLQAGKSRELANKAFIGAGTGLGIGFMTYNLDGSYMVHHTEGGHVDFAPTDEIQVEVLKFLRKKYHRVSFERLLSGQGLVNIYRYVREHKMFGEEENLSLRFLLESDQTIDVAATVAEYAVKYRDIMALRALDIFMRIYGAAVGNLALTVLPYGGMYIVGGIAPKLLEQIKKGAFLEMFSDKGRMSNLLKEVPIYVVTNTDIGLQGAANYARKMYRSSGA